MSLAVEPRVIAGIIGFIGGLGGLATTIIAYTTLKPGLDVIALLAPPALAILTLAYYTTTKFKVELTPIAATPLAYTLYHIVAKYIRGSENMETLTFSIILGTTITLLLIPLTLILIRGRGW